MLKYEGIYQSLWTQIQEGKLSAGARLPSIRALMQAFSCSKSTVLTSLKMLEDQDLIYSKPKSGYYVVDHIMFKDPVSSDKIDFASASPTWQAFPYQDFQHCLNKAIDTYKIELFRYGMSKGLPSLIKKAERLLASYQVFAHTDQIFITSGVQQALSLLSFIPFPNHRSTILVEQPSYHLYMKLLKTHKIPVVGIKRTKAGIDLQQLEQIFREKDIKFFYTMPRFHNPLGTSYSKKEKTAILQLAQKYEVYIVEDDYLADFEYDAKNDPLYAEDIHDRVIYLKSFSKIMFPGLRIGLAVLPAALINSFADYKSIMDIDTSMISQAALEIYLKSGMFEHYRKKVSHTYHTRAKILQQTLKTYLSRYEYSTELVMHSHILLPIKVNMTALIKELHEQNIIIESIAPNYLDTFYQERILKINVSNVEVTQIEKGIEQITRSLENPKNNFI